MVVSLLVAFPGLRRQPIAQIGILFSADPTQTRAGGLVARVRDPPMIIPQQFPCDIGQLHQHTIRIPIDAFRPGSDVPVTVLQPSAASQSLPRPT